MQKLRAYILLLRPINLLIVALTLALIRYCVIVPAFNDIGAPFLLDHLHFGLFVFAIVLMTAAGNLINDIVDNAIDLINKPNKTYINTIIPESNARLVYWLLHVCGFVLSIYLGFHIGQAHWSWLYIAAAGLLHLYSTRLKQTVLIGNIVVSFFTAAVVLMLLLSEHESISNYWELLKFPINLVVGFAVFAFLSTLIREIIKDIEDVQGDQAFGLRTLPVAYGINNAQAIALAVVMILIISLSAGLTHLLVYLDNPWMLTYVTVCLLLPGILLLTFINRAKTVEQFSRLSKGLKVYMLLGLGTLILFRILVYGF